MKEINIGKIIINKRREKGVTQDDLANFIGVSKASVSKWETGHSYPDITFLPRLASYFDISLDELMGYEPQMIESDIRKLYEELAAQFTIQPFDEVMNRCRDVTKKYFSCYPLLFNIAALYINYGVSCGNEELKLSTLKEAKELLVRVRDKSNDIGLKQLALHLEATCEMMLGNPNEVMALLEGLDDLVPPSSFHVILAQAYVMTGRVKEAKTKLLGCILSDIINYLNTVPVYLSICADDKEHFEEVCTRTMGIIEIFKANESFPTAALPFYLTAAAGYLTIEDSEKALDMLEIYTKFATGDIFPIAKKIGGFFSLLDEQQEEPLFGIANVPRDEQSIKQSIADSVAENPVFSALENESRFTRLLEKLKNNIER